MTVALKEWHVASEAIARGDQVITVRKGGTGEKAFALAGARFWLYPTWEHQAPAHVKRAWHGELARSNRERSTDGRIPIRCHCEAVSAWEVRGEDAVRALDGRHLWTDAYLASRLRWRPTKPLTVVLLRASALVEPVLLAPSERYAGCRSWIELETAIDGGELIPALTPDAFELHARAIGDVLGEPTKVPG